jgi:hypothetical protein
MEQFVSNLSHYPNNLVTYFFPSVFPGFRQVVSLGFVAEVVQSINIIAIDCNKVYFELSTVILFSVAF